MSSIQSRMVLFLFRHGHLFQFRLKPKPILDSDASILEFRETVSSSAKKFGKVPENIEVKPVQIGDLYAEWMQPVDYTQQQTILYFHGGGYVAGTCEAHHGHVTKIVNGSGIRAFLFEYRLAPEHPYPAAVEDSIAAYQYLLEQGVTPEQIVFMGDSAGAGLTLATLLALKDQGFVLPAGAVALSPWTDLKCTGESYVTNAESCLSPQDSWTIFSKRYVGNNDPTHPWISPLYGNLEGLPPLRLYVSSNEIFRDDSIRFADKARAAGVDVSLTVGEDMFHCYPVCAPLFPEATQAMNEIWEFMHEQLERQPARVV